MSQYFVQRGCYRRCSYGQQGARVYAAWYSKSKWAKFSNDAVNLGYWRSGSDEQKQLAAENACKDHHYSLEKKAG